MIIIVSLKHNNISEVILTYIYFIYLKLYKFISSNIFIYPIIIFGIRKIIKVK